jgi:hypothetical protein
MNLQNTIHIIATIGDPEMWQNAGGLMGLIIFALFASLFAFFYVLTRKDKHHTELIEKVMRDERTERHADRTEQREMLNGLSHALKELAAATKSMHSEIKHKL